MTANAKAHGKSKIIAVVLSAIVALAAAMGFAATSSNAPDSKAAEIGNGQLLTGGEIDLGGAKTNLYSINEVPAVCSTPGRAAPESGEYPLYTDIRIQQQSNLPLLKAIMWSSYQAPGFDADLYPTTYYDGTPMNAEKYQIATYLMASTVYGMTDWGSPLDGANEEFSSWANSEVLGKTMSKMETQQQYVPHNFTLVEIRGAWEHCGVLSYQVGGYLGADVTSSDEPLVNENPLYTLAGSTYNIYEDEACTRQVGVLEIEADGSSNTIFLNAGTYYIKQKTPSAGYVLSTEVTAIEVAGNVTTTANLTSTPLANGDPIHILKRDSDHNAQDKSNDPQGGASLAGAIYRISYYDSDSITSIAQAQAATPVWTEDIMTSWDGSAATAVPTNTQILAHGQNGWPIGTYMVNEVQAPVEGYLADTSAPYLFAITANSANNPTAAVTKVTVGSVTGNPQTPISATNPLVSADPIMKGDISILRYMTGAGTTGQVPATGAQFQIVNDNDYPVMNVETGAWVAKGGVVYTLTIGDNAYATTKTLQNNYGGAGHLPYGTYTIREVASSVPGGGATVGSLTTSIMKNGQERFFTFDGTAGAMVKVQKIDEETQKPVPGLFEFRIKNTDTNEYVAFNDTFPESNRLVTMSSDANGALMLPSKLPAGNYAIEEVSAPYGYVKASAMKNFTITSEQATVSSYANPVQQNFADLAQKAQIEVTNKDRELGNKIINAAATYDVIAAEDIVTPDGEFRAPKGKVVSHIITGANAGNATDGVGISAPLYLGKYIVVQTTAPTGYVLDENKYEVVLSYSNQNEAITKKSITCTNKQVKGFVSATKTDATSNKVVPVAGISFEVKAAENIVAKTGDVIHQAGNTIDIITTGADGIARCDKPLTLGKYSVTEIEAPYAYHINETPTEIALAYKDQNTAEVYETGTVADERTVATFMVSKNDAESHQLVYTPGTKVGVYAAEDIVMPEGSVVFSKDQEVDLITIDETGYGKGTHPAVVGNYYLREVKAPDGYVLDAETTYPAAFLYPGQDEQNLVVSGAIEDMPQKGTITFTKHDADTGKIIPVAGIKVNIYANEDIVTGDRVTHYTKDQLVVEGLVTGSDGVATTDPLYLGSYRVQEVQAPEGYLINETPVNVTLSYAGQNVEVTTAPSVIEDENVKGVIKVTKIDKETQKSIPVAGTTFSVVAKTDIVTPDGTVRTPAGTEVGPIFTDENGVATLEDLFLGTYTVTETKAPEGYTLSTEPQDAVLAWKDQVTALVFSEPTVTNIPQKGIITIEKRDAESDKTVLEPGAIFNVTAAEDIVTPDGTQRAAKGEVVDTVTTVETGKISTKALYLGTYTVNEVKAPKGYVLTDETKNVTLSYGDQTEPLVYEDEFIANQVVMGTFSIDAFDNRVKTTQLADTTWEIRAAEDITTADGVVHAKSGEVVDTVTTVAEGKAVSKQLYLGKYEIVQTMQVNGYERDFDTHAAELSYIDDQTPVVNTDLTYYNDPTDFSMKIVNAQNGEILTDVEFVAWDTADATEFKGFAVYSDNEIKSASVTKVADFDNLSASYERTIALSSNANMSSGMYDVFTSDAPMEQGVYMLDVEYVGADGKEYAVSEKFYVNENDDTAIFFIGELGAYENMKNRFDGKADTISNEGDSTDKPVKGEATDENVASNTVSWANKVLKSLYEAGSKIEEGYKANTEMVDGAFGDLNTPAVKGALTNMSSFLQERTIDMIENYPVEPKGGLSIIEDYEDGAQLTADAVQVCSEVAKALENEGYEIAVPRDADIMSAIKIRAAGYVTDAPEKFSVKSSTDDISAFGDKVLKMIADKDVPEAAINNFEDMLADAKNGEYDKLMQLVELNNTYDNAIREISHVLDAAEADDFFMGIKNSVERSAFIISVLSNNASNRDELLTAPSGILHRVPVILNTTKFAASASDEEGVVEFRYITIGRAGIAESRTVDGYATNSKPMYLTVNDEGYITDVEAPEHMSYDKETGELLVDVHAVKLLVSKMAAETGTELPGNTLSVVKVDADGTETLIDTWVTDSVPHELDKIVPGDYILREDTPAEGYSQADEISFRVLDTEGDQRVSMDNTLIPVVPMAQLGDVFPIVAIALILAGAAIGAVGYNRYRKGEK